ncbi:hypothetical protein HZH66_006960 [Vespula vulgaris]|uniref:Uncharacterized protein n=1 Tax=Vespula vulgaris TaxID=7454 RepID=A0A834N995_VESVU|nr:hypothetical protein HZH66_006960 [Vespula vulgaris]
MARNTNSSGGVNMLNHLKKAGYKKELNVWVPHDLTMKTLMDQISGNEKWITYDNNVRKKLYPHSTINKSSVGHHDIQRVNSSSLMTHLG